MPPADTPRSVFAQKTGGPELRDTELRESFGTREFRGEFRKEFRDCVPHLPVPHLPRLSRFLQTEADWRQKEAGKAGDLSPGFRHLAIEAVCFRGYSVRF
jgi:hypothetical protein